MVTYMFGPLMLALEWDPDHLPDPTCRELQIICFSSEVTSLHRLSELTFHKLTVLKVSRIGLESLVGIDAVSFPSLRILFCSYNRLVDIAPLFDHPKLEILDLEGNRLEDKSNLSVLSSIPNLTELDISGNPIACSDDLSSDTWIKKNLRTLRVLNESCITNRPSSSASTAASARPMTARVTDEIALIVDHARRPCTARPPSLSLPLHPQPPSELNRTDSFSGNPIGLIRSNSATRIHIPVTQSTTPTQPISRIPRTNSDKPLSSSTLTIQRPPSSSLSSSSTISRRRGPVKVFPPLRRSLN